jgi:hypothetical protein
MLDCGNDGSAKAQHTKIVAGVVSTRGDAPLDFAEEAERHERCSRGHVGAVGREIGETPRRLLHMQHPLPGETL